MDEATVTSTFAPLLAKLGTPSDVFLQKQDWLTSVLYLAGVDSVSQLNTTLAPDAHDTFYATSTFVPSAAPMMNQAASDALFAYFYGPGVNTEVLWFAIFDLYGGGDSVIARADKDMNAFDARDALYSIQYYGTIPASVEDADGIAFVQGMKKAVESNQPETQFKEYGECCVVFSLYLDKRLVLIGFVSQSTTSTARIRRTRRTRATTPPTRSGSRPSRTSMTRTASSTSLKTFEWS